MKATIIVIVIALVLVLWGVALNNHIVALHEGINGAWAQVETVLQRRYDLIPNLVSTVKGYAAHESKLFEEVTQMRSQWATAKTTEDKVAAASTLAALDRGGRAVPRPQGQRQLPRPAV